MPAWSPAACDWRPCRTAADAIAGRLMDTLLWDLPLQRAAWRAYVASDTQRDRGPGTARRARRRCACSARRSPTGWCWRPAASWTCRQRSRGARWPPAGRWCCGTRTSGSARAAGRPSPPTWPRCSSALAADDRAVLLVRPHFRLFPDLRAAGRADLEARLRAAVARHPHVVLDESPDHLAALTACDAMLSDLSSLATELLPTGTPVLYLHRADGPGTNAEGAHFAEMYRADGWDDVAAFLDRVVAGEDPQRAQRLAAVAADMPLVDGRAGRRMADDLVDGLLDDLRVDVATLAPRLAPVVVHGLAVGGADLAVDADAALSLGGPAVPPQDGRAACRWTCPWAPTSSAARPAPRSRSRATARGPPAHRQHQRPGVDPRGRLVLTVASPVPLPTASAATQRPLLAGPRDGAVHSFDGRAVACNPLALQRALRRPATRPSTCGSCATPDARPGGCTPLLKAAAAPPGRGRPRPRWVVDNDAMADLLDKRPARCCCRPGTARRSSCCAGTSTGSRRATTASWPGATARPASGTSCCRRAAAAEVLPRAFRTRRGRCESGSPATTCSLDPAARAAPPRGAPRARPRRGHAASCCTRRPGASGRSTHRGRGPARPDAACWRAARARTPSSCAAPTASSPSPGRPPRAVRDVRRTRTWPSCCSPPTCSSPTTPPACSTSSSPAARSCCHVPDLEDYRDRRSAASTSTWSPRRRALCHRHDGGAHRRARRPAARAATADARYTGLPRPVRPLGRRARQRAGRGRGLPGLAAHGPLEPGRSCTPGRAVQVHPAGPAARPQDLPIAPGTAQHPGRSTWSTSAASRARAALRPRAAVEPVHPADGPAGPAGQPDPGAADLRVRRRRRSVSPAGDAGRAGGRADPARAAAGGAGAAHAGPRPRRARPAARARPRAGARGAVHATAG